MPKEKLIKFQGQEKSLSEWARVFGINKKTLWNRIFRSKPRMTMAVAVSTTNARIRHGHASGEFSGTYSSWQAMISRCRVKTGKSYPNYGGAGVKVCKRWRVFENFLADMGERPAGLTLDRFPVTSKIYSKKTCRWATPIQQARNKKGHKQSSSKYKGVYWSKTRSKWIAIIGQMRGDVYYKKNLGSFTSETSAAEAYDEAARVWFGEDAYLNFGG